MRKLFLSMSVCAVFALGFLNVGQADDVRCMGINCVTEVVELMANVDVKKCSTRDNVNLCTQQPIMIENIKVVMERKETPEGSTHDLWEGSWSKIATKEGVDFIGSLNIKKYRYYHEDKSWDSYRIEGTVGQAFLVTPIPHSAKISTWVSSMEDLNHLTLAGDITALDDFLLTPHLYFGAKIFLEPIDPENPVSVDPDVKRN